MRSTVARPTQAAVGRHIILTNAPVEAWGRGALIDVVSAVGARVARLTGATVDAARLTEHTCICNTSLSEARISSYND